MANEQVGGQVGEPDQATRVRRLQPGQAAAIWGVVAVAWAVFLVPPFFGAVGFALGALAWRRGERRGRWIMIAAVVATLVGLGINQLPDWFVSN
jgi:hypothetical protein